MKLMFCSLYLTLFFLLFGKLGGVFEVDHLCCD